MDVSYDLAGDPAAGGAGGAAGDDQDDSPHNSGSFSGAEIFVEQRPVDGGGGGEGGGGPGGNDGLEDQFNLSKTSGITMYDLIEAEVGGDGTGAAGAGSGDPYEEQYVDDQGGYGHQSNPAAHHHDGAAGYGGVDDFGGGDVRAGGGAPAQAYGGGEYGHGEDYDEDYNDIGFDGRDLRSEPSRSSSSRSLQSRQSSRLSSNSSGWGQHQQMQQPPQYKHQPQDQPQYGYAGGEDEYYNYYDESKVAGDSLYRGRQAQSNVPDYSAYPQEDDGQDLPCISLAGYELDSMKFAQRRHVSYLEQTLEQTTQPSRSGGGGGNKGGQRILDEFSDIPLPSRQSYPADCLQILRLLDSNGGCVDCGAGLDGKTEPPMWASISYGTLLCDKCAFVHLTKSEEKSYKHMSLVKHLDTGYWTLPEVLTMLEGGNGNFLLAVQGHKQMRRPSPRSNQRLGKGGSKLGLSGLAPIDEKGNDMAFVGGGKGRAGRSGPGGLATGGLFEAKYKNKQAAAYCAMLQQRVQAVSGAFHCDQGLPFDVAQQDVQVDEYHERPIPAKVRLRDPPTREEVLQAKMDASRASTRSKSRGDSTISGSSRFGTITTRSSGMSSNNPGSVRSKASSSLRSSFASTNKSKISAASQIHTIYEEDGLSEVSPQPSRRASDESKQGSKASSASASAKNSSKKTVADPPSSSVQKDSPAPQRKNSVGSLAGPCPPTKLVRRMSDPANHRREKKNKMRKQTKRQKKQERRRRASLP